MKKYLTLLFFFLIFKAQSQTSISAAEWATVGDTVKLKVTDTLALTIPSAGTGVQWDYSTAVLQSNGIQYRYKAVTSTDFSNANLLEEFSGTGGFGAGQVKTYFYRTSNTLQVNGQELATQKIVTSSMPEVLKFPVNKGDVQTSSYNTSYKGLGGFTTTYRRGTWSSEGMGNGVLKLAGGVNINDAVLVKISHDYVDSTVVFTQTFVLRTVIDQYIWFEKGKRGQIFVIQSTKNGLGSTLPTRGATLGMMKDTTVTKPNGIMEVASQTLNLFPNPVSQTIHVSCAGDFPNSAHFRIVNGQGQTIKHGNVNSYMQGSQFVYPCEQLQNGQYILLLERENMRQSIRFIIAK